MDRRGLTIAVVRTPTTGWSRRCSRWFRRGIHRVERWRAELSQPSCRLTARSCVRAPVGRALLMKSASCSLSRGLPRRTLARARRSRRCRFDFARATIARRTSLAARIPAIWAFGAVLFEMLTGNVHPGSNRARLQILTAHWIARRDRNPFGPDRSETAPRAEVARAPLGGASTEFPPRPGTLTWLVS